MSSIYVVTSSTKGIGAAIVERIFEKDENAFVIANYAHNTEDAEIFLNRNEKNRNRLLVIKADLSTKKGLDKFTNEIGFNYGQIDYLVCNTGISAYGNFDDYSFEEWNRVLQTNLTIPAFLVKTLKYKFNPNGSILFMGSEAGIRTYSSSIAYSVSKAALIHLSKCLVKEFEPLNVRVNSLAPGFIETSWQRNRSQESYDRINKKIALHRFGLPEEVADLAISILTNTYVNGEVVSITGGYDYF